MLISIGLYTLAAVEEKFEVIVRYATVCSAICIAVTCFVSCSPWDTFTDGDESATPPSPPTVSDDQDSNDDYGEGSDE